MDHSPFAALLLITGLAFVLPLLAQRFRRLRLPIVVWEILAGIIIGKSGLDLVEPSSTLNFLAEFGFAYLMFLSGLEVDFNLLTRSPGKGRQTRFWQRPLSLAVLLLALTLALAVGAGAGLQRAGLVQDPILMGLILSTTSLGVVVPVLKERELLKNPFGQFLLVSASISDFVTLLLLTVAIAVTRRGLTLDLLLIPVLLVLFALAARLGRRFGSFPLVRRLMTELSHATAQLRIRGAFALMVAWVVLAEALGVELILGAFLAGAIAGLMGDPDDAQSIPKLEAIGFGFFIPIFFIMVGVEFNLWALLSSTRGMVLVPLLLVIAYAVKIIPGQLARLRFSSRQALAGGILLSSRLSLIIAASAIALSLGAIDEAVNAAAISLAIITCSVSPVLFNRLMPPEIVERRQGVIIAGGDQMAVLLARRLRRSGEEVVLVGPEEAAVDRLKAEGLLVVTGDPNRRATLRAAGAQRASSLVAMCADQACTIDICTLAIREFGIPTVAARISELELIEPLQRLGVKVVQPAIATAVALEGALRYPTAFDVLVDQADDVEVGEVVLRNPEVADRPLRTLSLPGNALVLSVKRDGSVMVPDGESSLLLLDTVAVIGSPESVAQAVDLLGG